MNRIKTLNLEDPIMKDIFIPVVLILLITTSILLSCSVSKYSNERNFAYNVSGKIITNKLYCGGAQPTQAILDALKTPIAFKNKTLYVKYQSDNYSEQEVVSSFTSNNLGEFTLQLKPGKYAVFVEEQINKQDYKDRENLILDQACSKAWLNKPYYIIDVVNEHINGIEFTFPKRCFIKEDNPCLRYTGPRPG